MRSNAYSLANFRFDSAENDPAKNLQNISYFLVLRHLQVFLREVDPALRVLVVLRGFGDASRNIGLRINRAYVFSKSKLEQKEKRKNNNLF